MKKALRSFAWWLYCLLREKSITHKYDSIHNPHLCGDFRNAHEYMCCAAFDQNVTCKDCLKIMKEGKA